MICFSTTVAPKATATIEDLELAIEACHSVGNNDITLLKCTSAYPAPLEKANLLTIPDMKERFGVKVGVSDHSLTNTLPIVAIPVDIIIGLPLLAA